MFLFNHIEGIITCKYLNIILIPIITYLLFVFFILICRSIYNNIRILDIRYTILDFWTIFRTPVLISTFAMIIILLIIYIIDLKSEGYIFFSRIKDNFESYIFGLITYLSLIITISSIIHSFNQIFLWDQALLKVKKLIKRGNDIKIFFWTPLIGCITHHSTNVYKDFYDTINFAVEKFLSDQKKIEIICLDDDSLVKLYDRYKKSDMGNYENSIVEEALHKTTTFINLCKSNESVSLLQKSQVLLPTFYFIISEKEMIVLLPFFMPIHDSYKKVKGIQKVKLYGFATRDRYMMSSFKDSFDFYKKLQE